MHFILWPRKQRSKRTLRVQLCELLSSHNFNERMYLHLPTCMVDICDVVPLGGLPAGVVDDCEELVLPLLGGVLGLGDRAEQLATDLEVHAELHLLHHLLTPPTGPAVHKPGNGG